MILPPKPDSNGQEPAVNPALASLMSDRQPNSLLIMELDPSSVLIPDSNRPVTPDSITDLLASIEEYSQLVAGIVSAHPTKPGFWLCRDGSRRLLATRILGIKFLAVEHEGEATDEALALTRLTLDRTHKRMTDEEVAADLDRIQKARDCKQAELALLAGISSPEVNRILSFPKRAIPEVIESVRAGRICRSSARLMASLIDPDLQRQALAKVESVTSPNGSKSTLMKRDGVQRLVASLKNKKTRSPKPLTLRGSGIKAVVKNPTLESLLKFGEGLVSAAKKAAKEGRNVESVQSLLDGLLKS